MARDAKIPLVASDPDSVKRGAVAALGMNYYDMGRQAGKVVNRVLKGEKPGAIASETGASTKLVLNESAAAAQGVTLSDALRKEAAEVIK